MADDAAMWIGQGTAGACSCDTDITAQCDFSDLPVSMYLISVSNLDTFHFAVKMVGLL